MHKDGNNEFSNGNYDMALLRYAQGVELLKWVEGPSDEHTFQLDDMLLIFLKNQAQAALRVGRWSEALSAAEHALSLSNQRDPKALFRKGEALQLLGRVTDARETFLQLMKLADEDEDDTYAEQSNEHSEVLPNDDANTTAASTTASSRSKSFHLSAEQRAEAKRASQIGLERLNVLVKAEKARAKAMVTGLKGIFSREPSTKASSPVSPAVNHDQTIPEDRVAAVSTSNTFFEPKKTLRRASTEKGSAAATTAASPKLSLMECRQMMKSLEEHYASAGFQFVMKQHRDLADYDERRILIRARKALPELIAPIIRDYGFDNQNCVDAASECQKCIDYYRSKDKEILAGSSRLLKLILGDALNLDVE